MKLGINYYYDLFYPANSVVWSLKSYFDRFGEPTLSPKTLKLVRGLRRRTYDFEYNYRCIWLIIEMILVYLYLKCTLIANSQIHQLFFLKRTHMTTKGCVLTGHYTLTLVCKSTVLMRINSGLNHTKIVLSRRSKIRKVCFQTTK